MCENTKCETSVKNKQKKQTCTRLWYGMHMGPLCGQNRAGVIALDIGKETHFHWLPVPQLPFN